MDASKKFKLLLAVIHFSAASQLLGLTALTIKASQSNCAGETNSQTWISKDKLLKETVLGRMITALSDNEEVNETESKESLPKPPEAYR